MKFKDNGHRWQDMHVKFKHAIHVDAEKRPVTVFMKVDAKGFGK